MTIVESVNKKSGVVELPGLTSEGELPSSVVSSSAAALGQTFIPNGKGGGAWETGVGPAIDLREIIEGVKQEAEIAKALNAAMASLPAGARIFLPPLPGAVEITAGEGEADKHATLYLCEEGLQFTTECTLCGPGGLLGRVVLRKASADPQIWRNWQLTDYQAGRTDAGCGVTKNSTTVTDSSCVASDEGKIVRDARASTPAGLGYPFGVQVLTTIVSVVPGVSFTMSREYKGATGTISCMIGEPDHLIAPLTTAAPTYEPKIENLGLDIYGWSNSACIGVVHPQEEGEIKGIVYQNLHSSVEATQLYCRMTFCNNDSGGTIAGVLVKARETAQGKHWTTMILEDGTCGGKIKSVYPTGAAVTRDLTTPVSLTSAVAFTSSPLKYIGLSCLTLGPVHMEAAPPQEGPTIAISDGTMTGTAVLKTAGSIIFCGHHCGRTISDSESKIPAGTIIDRYISSTEVELSNVATLAPGDVITIGPDDAGIRIMDCAGVHINDTLISPHFLQKRPWIRQTSGEKNQEREPMSHPLITAGHIVQNPDAESHWEPGAPIIEDYSDDEVLYRLLATTGAFDPREIKSYDGETIVWWDGESSQSRSARLHPRAVPDGELWTPARQGLLSANGDVGNLPASVVPTAGVLTLAWIPMPWHLVITKLWYYLVEQTGNTFTTNENFLGLYTAAGALAAQTKDLSASWGGEGPNDANVEHALWHNVGAPLPYLGSGMWLAILVNGTIVKMKFSTVGSLGTPNLIVPGGHEYYRCGTFGTGLKELPPTITPSEIASLTKLAWGGTS